MTTRDSNVCHGRCRLTLHYSSGLPLYIHLLFTLSYTFTTHTAIHHSLVTSLSSIHFPASCVFLCVTWHSLLGSHILSFSRWSISTTPGPQTEPGGSRLQGNHCHVCSVHRFSHLITPAILLSNTNVSVFVSNECGVEISLKCILYPPVSHKHVFNKHKHLSIYL